MVNIELAFAETTADRDYEGFKSFLSKETIFFSSDRSFRGKKTVTEAWKSYFETPEAPFSRKPERIEALDSGTLALSTGPVHDSKGKLIGTFTSIWRLEENDHWRIIFDIGNPVCE